MPELIKEVALRDARTGDLVKLNVPEISVDAETQEVVQRTAHLQEQRFSREHIEAELARAQSGVAFWQAQLALFLPM